MSYIVAYSAEAQKDVDQLLQYLVEHAGEQVAVAFVGRLTKLVEGLETFPKRGTVRRGKLRIIGFERRLSVAFLVSGRHVTIARVYGPGRDLKI